MEKLLMDVPPTLEALTIGQTSVDMAVALSRLPRRGRVATLILQAPSLGVMKNSADDLAAWQTMQRDRDSDCPRNLLVTTRLLVQSLEALQELDSAFRVRIVGLDGLDKFSIQSPFNFLAPGGGDFCAMLARMASSPP